MGRKAVKDWTADDFAYWVSQQPVLSNDSPDFERAIKKGKITGGVLSLQTKDTFNDLKEDVRIGSVNSLQCMPFQHLFSTLRGA